MVSGTLIPEHNGLSQFNEDTDLCLSENLHTKVWNVMKSQVGCYN